MPFPPPPAAALIRIGNGIFLLAANRLSVSPTTPSTSGISIDSMNFRAWILLPINSIEAALGPMNTILLASQASTNFEFSARNP